MHLKKKDAVLTVEVEKVQVLEWVECEEWECIRRRMSEN
jgi:hypothetical protein